MVSLEMREILPSASIPVPFPSYRHALGCCRYLEHDDTTARMSHLPDAAERHAGLRAVVNLLLESVEPFWIGSVLCSDDGSRPVSYAENEPAGGAFRKVRFIAERRDVTTYIVGVEVVASFFELNGLIFPVLDEGREELEVLVVGCRPCHVHLRKMLPTSQYTASASHLERRFPSVNLRQVFTMWYPMCA